MKKKIRRGVFETNSSSTHSLTMCSEDEYEEWKKGELLYDRYSENFVSINSLSPEQKLKAASTYQDEKDDFQKNWNELTELAQEKYYTKYAKENNLIDEDAITYDEFLRDGDLETFVERYTTKSGDKIVAFGEYGYDG